MAEPRRSEATDEEARAVGANELSTDGLDVGSVSGRGGRQAERAFVLIGLGTFLFLPATVTVAAKPAYFAGLPVIWIYLFGSWLLLILGAAALSRLFRSGGPDAADEPLARAEGRGEP